MILKQNILRLLTVLLFFFYSSFSVFAERIEKYYNYDESGNILGYTEQTFDNNGNIIISSSRDASGNLVSSDPISGYPAQTRYTYDRAGNRIEERFFDAHEEPQEVGIWGGIAGYQHVYNSQHEVIQTTYLGKDGKPKTNNDGVAIEKMKYNKNGMRIFWGFFNTLGKKTEKTNEMERGISFYLYTYDKNGNLTQESTYNIYGKRQENGNGIAKIRMKYNAKGMVSEDKWYNAKGEKTAHRGSDGIFSNKYWYYDHGGLKEVHHFNALGELTDFGIAIEKIFYNNENGDFIISEKFFDKNMNLVREVNY